MAVFSKKICEDKLKTWLEAEDAVAAGQSYQLGTRMLTRASLKQIREQIEFWSGKLAEAQAEETRTGRNRAFRFIPLD